MNPKEADKLLEGGPLEQVNQELSANPSTHVESTDYGARVEIGPDSEIYDTASETYEKLDRQLGKSPDHNETISQFGRMTGIMIGAALERTGEHLSENYPSEVMRTTYRGEEVASKPVRSEDNPFTPDFNPKKPVYFAKYLFEDIENAAKGKEQHNVENLDQDDLVGDQNFTSSMAAGLDQYLSSDIE